MIKADYIIIGTGPVGVFAAKYLLEKGKSIVVLDNSKKENLTNFDSLKLKNIESHSFVYDFQNTAYKNNKKVLPISSKVKGGFSRVWGGTLNSIEEHEILRLGLSIEKYKTVYNYLLNTIPNFTLNDFSKNFSNKNSKIKISAPVLGIQNQDTRFWSADMLFNDLIKKFNKKIQYFDNIDVKNIEIQKDFFKIISSDNEYLFDSKKIFVCSGIFSSSQIASRMLNIKKFKISDSEISVWPVMHFGKKINNDKKIDSVLNGLNGKAYSKLMISLRKNKSFIKCQLYDINDESISEIKKRIPLISKPIIFLLKKMVSRIFLLFIYKDSDHSKKGLFEVKNSKVSIIKTNLPKKNISILKFFGSFLKHKFVLIPIRYRFMKYGSFHSGNLEFINKNRQIEFDSFGQLPNFNNIHFIDSSSMKYIPSGPFTITSVIHSQNLLDKISNEK